MSEKMLTAQKESRTAQDIFGNTPRRNFWLPVVSIMGGINEQQIVILSEKLYSKALSSERVRTFTEVFAELDQFKNFKEKVDRDPILSRVPIVYTPREMEMKWTSFMIPVDSQDPVHAIELDRIRQDSDLIDRSGYSALAGEGPRRPVIKDLLWLAWADLLHFGKDADRGISFSLAYKGERYLKAMETIAKYSNSAPARITPTFPQLMRNLWDALK